MLKTIKINAPYFKNAKKTVKRIKPPIDMSQLKEKLQMNIQNRKNKSKNISIQTNLPTTTTTPTQGGSELSNLSQDEFTNSIQFMDKKVNTMKSSKSKVTIKSQKPNKLNKIQPTFENIIENPDMKTTSNNFSSKMYDNMSIPGCLKNGKKKTYKAITNHSISKPHVSFTPNIISNPSDDKPLIIPSIQTKDLQNIPLSNNNNFNTEIKPEQNHIQPTVVEPTPIHSPVPCIQQQLQLEMPKTDDIIDLTDDLSSSSGGSSNTANSKDIKEIKIIDVPVPEVNLEIPKEPVSIETNKEIKEITIHTNADPSIEPTKLTVVEPQPPQQQQPQSPNNIIENQDNNTNEPEINKIIKKTIKKYKLGKNVTRKVVSVLCKNKDTIQHIKKYTNKIGDTTVNQMKQYLINKTLLSIGSYAPDDVIKQMYLNAKLAGEIINHNDNLLLNNFITDSDSTV